MKHHLEAVLLEQIEGLELVIKNLPPAADMKGVGCDVALRGIVSRLRQLVHDPFGSDASYENLPLSKDLPKATVWYFVAFLDVINHSISKIRPNLSSAPDEIRNSFVLISRLLELVGLWIRKSANE